MFEGGDVGGGAVGVADFGVEEGGDEGEEGKVEFVWVEEDVVTGEVAVDEVLGLGGGILGGGGLHGGGRLLFGCLGRRADR